MDGGRHHTEDGIHFVESDSIFGHEMLLAQTHILALCLQFARLADGKAETGRDGCAWQHAESVAEELEF